MHAATERQPKTKSRTEANKQLAIAWLQWVSEGNIDSICRVTAPTWTMHGGLPGLPQGPEGVRRLFASFGPIEQQWTPDIIVAEGDMVVIRATNACRQESFFGVPASRRTQVFTATFIHHIVDGLVQETWRNADDLGRVLQLGAHIVAPEVRHAKEELL